MTPNPSKGTQEYHLKAIFQCSYYRSSFLSEVDIVFFFIFCTTSLYIFSTCIKDLGASGTDAFFITSGVVIQPSHRRARLAFQQISLLKKGKRILKVVIFVLHSNPATIAFTVVSSSLNNHQPSVNNPYLAFLVLMIKYNVCAALKFWLFSNGDRGPTTRKIKQERRRRNVRKT